ncbi:cell division protein FtsW [bacterium]|nr:cell division protein FtsW [bacterium]
MKPFRIFNCPFRIFLLTLFIASVGVIMVYSSSGSYASGQRRRAVARVQGAEALQEDHQYHNPRYVTRQILWLALGLCGMFAAYSVDYRRLKDAGPWLLLVSLIMLLLVYVPGIGVRINDHNRWIGFAGFTLQPSEIAKLALIIYMARMLTDHHDKITTSFLHGVAPALTLTGVFALAIIAEPDIGAAAVLSAIIFVMWFIGGMRILHLSGLVSATIPAFIYVVLMFPDRVARVVAFINPTPETSMGKGYQLLQSLIAVGSGGIQGIGLGNSMQKYFLTEQFSDFIFAIICEELGLIGAGLLVLCFLLLILEGWRVALRAPDFYSTLLAAGITLMLAISVTLNLMVVLGLAPTKGLALPLLSYGGTNMLVTLTSMGILMNIGKYVERQKEMGVPSKGGARASDRVRKSKRPPRRTRKWYEQEIA